MVEFVLGKRRIVVFRADIACRGRFESVHQSMHLQAQGAQHIHQSMTLLNESAQYTADSIRQSNAAIERLNDAAHNLQNGVTKFKVRKDVED